MEKQRIAVTMGDPAGVGPELCLRLLGRDDNACIPVVFGDAGVLMRVADELGLPNPTAILTCDEWPDAYPDVSGPSVLDLATLDADAVTPGTVNSVTGRASYEYISRAIDEAIVRRVDAVVTCPIHKEAFKAANVPYPGHTEMFADRTKAERSCMMLTSDEITCSLVTTHVGYNEVPALLSEARILEVIELSADAMARMRGRPARLTVCGLNPHAGESGLFGDREEERHIVTAVEAARARGLTIRGPLPPDTAFLPKYRETTDCFICMYHDQGLIPLKAIAFDKAVNVTLGLPIVRTSVDHGTALDIAWQGKADPNSLFEAVRLATKLASPTPVVHGEPQAP